jgi:hypothetical protein
VIIVKLKGGLGNQLFQYAAGRHLAEMHNTVLKLDLSLFKTYKLHAYSLKPFNISKAVASKGEVDELVYQKVSLLKRAFRKLKGLPPRLAKSYIKEKQFNFNPEILNLPDNVYLDGYWQSEKYFADISAIIRNEFRVTSPQDGNNLAYAKEIAATESVSIHIRRGSYLLPPYNSVHELSSLEYYRKSVDHIVKDVKNPHFFIFSDDHEWTRENLKLSYPATYLEQNDAGKDFEDLRLMSQCRHNICANSTFSWWGAWLNENKDKTVIVPEKWFIDPAMNTQDLIPAGWIRL